MGPDEAESLLGQGLGDREPLWTWGAEQFILSVVAGAEVDREGRVPIPYRVPSQTLLAGRVLINSDPEMDGWCFSNLLLSWG